jgi:hypothetical protein
MVRFLKNRTRRIRNPGKTQRKIRLNKNHYSLTPYASTCFGDGSIKLTNQSSTTTAQRIAIQYFITFEQQKRQQP